MWTDRVFGSYQAMGFVGTRDGSFQRERKIQRFVI
jgi:hypothetical protein